jgi:soluble P-type ATPase
MQLGHWQLFPGVIPVFQEFSDVHNFHIVSGIQDEKLRAVIEHFGLDRYNIASITGSSEERDKGTVLEELRARHKKQRVLYVGDCTRDREYAKDKDVNFYWIQDNQSWIQFLDILRQGTMPNMTHKLEPTEEQERFLIKHTIALLEEYKRTGEVPEAETIVNRLHA